MSIGVRMRTVMRWLVTIGIASAMLTACGGEDAGKPAATATPAPTATPIPAATPIPMSIGDVIWTTSTDPQTHEPENTVDQFANDSPVIIAAVQLAHVPQGTTLTATWTIDHVDVPEATMTTSTDTALKSGWAIFEFSREDGHLFPLGDLSVTISDGHGAAVTGDIQIVLPRE